MNLLCPHCQRMLSGLGGICRQLMKCPLCEGTFPVPGLPGAASPPPPPNSAPETDFYSLRHEPAVRRSSPADAPIASGTAATAA